MGLRLSELSLLCLTRCRRVLCRWPNKELLMQLVELLLEARSSQHVKPAASYVHVHARDQHPQPS
jgi:hypothetical protein